VVVQNECKCNSSKESVCADIKIANDQYLVPLGKIEKKLLQVHDEPCIDVHNDEPEKSNQ
jgi:DNA polymerase I-like protein with 3'-5' exonuclease and polymerase domains